MPLVYVGAEPVETPATEAHARARKIRPEYTEGELVRVAGARNQAEAELVQGLLLEEGIPSLLRRAPGFDVPDFLAAGPRDVLVPQAAAEAASEVLLEVTSGADEGRSSGTDPGPVPAAEGRSPSFGSRHAARLLALVLAGGGTAALLAWALLRLAG
jgi:hypothetical protein